MMDDEGVRVGWLDGRYLAVLREAGETVLSASGTTAGEAMEALRARQAGTPGSHGVAAENTIGSPEAAGSEGDVQIVVATEGALRNNHIRLTGLMGWFEADTVGGANVESRAASSVVVEWEGHPGITTDVDGTKAIFRNRGLIPRFMRDTGLQAGERVEITRLEPRRYRLRRCVAEI